MDCIFFLPAVVRIALDIALCYDELRKFGRDGTLPEAVETELSKVADAQKQRELRGTFLEVTKKVPMNHISRFGTFNCTCYTYRRLFSGSSSTLSR